MADPRPRIVVVGTGAFGRARAEAFAKRGAEVVFVSRDLERAKAATRAVGGPADRASAGLEDVLATARGVFVATPPACHSEAVLAAVRAGVSVLVEKPVEASLARARELERALGASTRLVSVAENFRFLPVLEPVGRLLASGALGELARLEVVVHRTRAPGGWRARNELAGGGVLMDLGPHYAHLLRSLAGELTPTGARAGERLPALEGEAAIVVEGTSARGAAWTIDMSWKARSRRSRVLLVGSRGQLRFRVGKPWLLRSSPRGWPLGLSRVGTRDPVGNEALVEDWLASLREGRPAAVTLEEGIRDVALVDAAYRLAGLA